MRACGKFFDIADRRVALETKLAQLDHDEDTVVAELTEVAAATAVAEMIGWTVTKVRAVAKHTTYFVGAGASGGGAEPGRPPEARHMSYGYLGRACHQFLEWKTVAIFHRCPLTGVDEAWVELPAGDHGVPLRTVATSSLSHLR